jgi:uncharacterized membrane protein
VSLDGSLTRRRTVAGTAAAAAGLATALVYGAPWAVVLLAAWDAFALVYVVWVWASVLPLDSAKTEEQAAGEDDSVRVSDLLLLVASVASLVAVGFALAHGHDTHAHRVALGVLAIGSVLLGWSTVHTVYGLRYARLYYASPVGGIGFLGDDRPDYTDFAYLAITIGMTYQVSDTDISRRPIRRTAIRHALLSYLFGAVILGITVNSIAAILGR